MTAVSLADLTEGVPAGTPVDPDAVAADVKATGRVLVVLDDDPTGTQSVADLPVLTGWEVEDLEWAITQGKPAVYVMTNSRSLAPAEAERVNREVARNALAASERAGVSIGLVSRSDSTMRGHFPLEPRVLAEEWRAAGVTVDGVLVVPAFGDAGRVTVHGVHYAGNDKDGYVPVGETEFAKDATFGYASSDLREWVEEKSGGEITAASVAVIDIVDLRSDPEKARATLGAAEDGQVIVADIVEENDLLLLAQALADVEEEGHTFLYRVGPPFTRGRIGQHVHAPLDRADADAIAGSGTGQDAGGGLIVVGSHVALTTRQLDALRARRSPTEIEIDVARVLDAEARQAHLDEVVRQAVDALATGNVVVRTSRTLVKGADGDSSLDIARKVSQAVVDVVQAILAQRPPRFVIAKGGITSSDVATRGLQIARAMVRGPMLPGIVSLWEPISGPAAGIPYIVFAGNVGSDESLADVVDKLSL